MRILIVSSVITKERAQGESEIGVEFSESSRRGLCRVTGCRRSDSGIISTQAIDNVSHEGTPSVS